MTPDKTYCINLKHRPERWERTQHEFKTRCSNIKTKRFNAIFNSKGWPGCRDSHLAVLKMCRDNKNIMIVEDDVNFLFDINALLATIDSQLPADWEMLYIGANFRSANFEKPLTKYSRNLIQVTQCWGTYAYIINNNNGLINEILSQSENIRKIDVFYAEHIQPRGKCYAIYPMAATIYDGYSDVTRKETDYQKSIYNSYYKNIQL